MPHTQRIDEYTSQPTAFRSPKNIYGVSDWHHPTPFRRLGSAVQDISDHHSSVQRLHLWCQWHSKARYRRDVANAANHLVGLGAS
ncbi:MAG TPA: hypothetical protein DDZ51_18760 [Planctomycetaceae bacterium]|nr:hypothetical protein [Planctomycetaceae bacterium]